MNGEEVLISALDAILSFFRAVNPFLVPFLLLIIALRVGGKK